jgi:hypothetical protein
MSDVMTNLGLQQAAQNAAAGRSLALAGTAGHYWAANMLASVMHAIRRYGPELLQAGEEFAATPTGQKVEGYLAAKAEAAGIPDAFVAHAGLEVLALAAKLEAWNAAAPAP